MIPVYLKDWTLRILFGPQDEQFTHEARESFQTGTFLVTPQSDRVGIRLQGPSLNALDGLETSIISEGVVPGAIQVPGDGQPIILLNETVTGGYRKIATVISTDIPKLGQVKPGDTVDFEIVSEAEALQALEELERVIRTLGR